MTGAPKRRCPACNAKYDPHVEFCFIDGAALVSGDRPTQTSTSNILRTIAPAIPQHHSNVVGIAMTFLAVGGASLIVLGLIAIVLISRAEPRHDPDVGKADLYAARYLEESMVLVDEGSLKAAEDLLERAMEQHPTDPNLVIQIARQSDRIHRTRSLKAAEHALEAGDLTGAREHLSSVLEGSPNDSVAMGLLEVLRVREDLDAATRSIDAAAGSNAAPQPALAPAAPQPAAPQPAAPQPAVAPDPPQPAVAPSPPALVEPTEPPEPDATPPVAPTIDRSR